MCRIENCNLKNFENSDKCILHCEKDNWNKDNDEQFYQKLKEVKNKKLKGIHNQTIIFKQVCFPEINYKDILDFTSSDFNTVVFMDCIFSGKFFIVNKVCEKEIHFKNCKFEKSIVFTKTTFLKKIYFFNNTEVKKILNLTAVCFKDDFLINDVSFNEISFRYSQVEETLFFKNVEVKKEIDLSHVLSIKKREFYNIKAKVKDRETARIIKDSFEQQNNIIEANKYYAIEMEKAEDDFKKDKKWFDWLVFKIHGLTSNHSQDWTLALFWIIQLSFIYSFIIDNIEETRLIDLFARTIISLVWLFVVGCMIIRLPKKVEKRWLTTIPITIVSYILYLYNVDSDSWRLEFFSNNINPFSIMTEFSEVTFLTLVYKIIIAYLIYQLIVSIRQNTRRK